MHALAQVVPLALSYLLNAGQRYVPLYLIFHHYGLRRSVVAQKVIFHEPSREDTQKFQFAVQIEVF